MIRYENYKDNVDVIDKFNIKNDIIARNMTCHLKDLPIIHRRKETVKEENPPQPMAAAVLGIHNTEAPRDECVPRMPHFTSTWSDIDEQQLYVKTRPNCFIIISKPGAGSYSLGEAIAKKFKCVHLCPRNVIIDEIVQNTPTGKCIDFNLRHYKECKVDTIIPLIKEKIKSPVVQNRGYVLSGLPLVSCSRSEWSFFKQLSNEDSILLIEEILTEILINMKKKKKKAKVKDTESAASVSSAPHEGGEAPDEEEEEVEEEANEEAEEEEDPAVELPQFLLEPCEHLITSKRNYYDSSRVSLINQINQMLKLDLKPEFTIYISCPDEDLVTKKNHKFLDYSYDTYCYHVLSVPVITDERCPPKYDFSDYVKKTSSSEGAISNNKYQVVPPMNHTKLSTEQLCNYKKYALSFLERKFNDINPKMIIKVDGRISDSHMLYNVSERLIMLPQTKKVILPEPMYLEEIEDVDEFWRSVEETNVIKCDVLTFHRYASPWYMRCPVELKKRKSIRGKIKYAVTFFKHVYLLSSLDALVSFWKNPRPFLQLQFLEPTCRIIVTGTKLSGKTMIAECMSWIFNTPIINYQDLYDEEKQKKYDFMSKSILSEIIATIEDARYEKWQQLDAQRLSDLESWHTQALSNLKKYIALFREIENQRDQGIDLTSPVGPAARLMKNFNNFKRLLQFLPFVNDRNQCATALASKNVREYAPAKFTIIPDKPTLPLLGDPDVTEAITAYIEANDLQKEIDPSYEEIMTFIINLIKQADDESLEVTSTYGKYIIDSFPSDPEIWSFLSEAKLLPDYTIALIENREVDAELLQHYNKLDKTLKNHREQYLQAVDPLIDLKRKYLDNEPEVSEVTLHHIHKILHDTLRDTMFMITDEDSEQLEAEEISGLTQSFEKFREEWEGSKAKLEEEFRCFIEVELDVKTDVQIVEEVLRKLRQGYTEPCEPHEGDEVDEPEDKEDDPPKDYLVFNDRRFLCETSIYCPLTFFDYNVLWEGKSEFCIKFGNKIHYFANEECMEKFKQDPTMYQSFCKPHKKLPPFRICVMGGIGSGKTSVSKFIAKELGLLHIDFEEALNTLLMPRHFKKVGRRHENIFTDISLDEEAVVEFQMGEEDENQITDMLFNENELRRMVYNYLEKGTPLVTALLQKLLKKIWFEDPFVTTGFILDGFPRVSNDVEDMIACYCVPDLVLELESSSEVALERISAGMFTVWKSQQNEAKAKSRKKFYEQKQEWFAFIAKNVVCKTMFEDILSNVMSIVAEPEPVLSNQSAIIDADPTANLEIDPYMATFYDEMKEEYPEPEDTSEWEKNDDARERIEGRIESIFEFDEENISTLRDLLYEQKIKCSSVDSSQPFNKVIRKVLQKLSSLRGRCDLFEQTFIIDTETAETLLSEGYYFLSRYQRLCPVFVYEHPNAITNPYKMSKRKNTLFSVVHRSYIYFIHGKDAVEKFRKSPLPYIECNNVMTFHEYPLRLAVIGPPKSGKSTLAAKLADHYGLVCLSSGLCIRNILKNLHWTKLAIIMNKALLEGDSVGYELIVQAVQVALMDYRTAIYGFVFDGIPQFPSEAMELEKRGIYPQLIFDLGTGKEKIINNSQNEVHYDIIKYLPPYCETFINFKYSKWNDSSYKIRNFIRDDCQNIVNLNGDESKWQCYDDVKKYMKSIIPRIHYYISNVRSDLVLPVDVMAISNDVFKNKCSSFQNFCPVCLRNKFLRYSNDPIDRKGMIQFRGLFYWICPEHMEMVLSDPDQTLLSRRVEIPEVPAIVKIINPFKVYENGVCIVTYAENLPAQIIKTGSHKYAARYKQWTYLFCDDQCLKKFLDRPHMYFDITVFKETKSFPEISLKKLPNIGYLEQSLGDILTKACCAVNVVRPKYPGLDIDKSALVFIGLFLKVNNHMLDPAVYPLYKRAFTIYEARSKYIMQLGLRMRSIDNPFMSYPKCCKNRKHTDSTVCKPTSFTSSSPFLSHANATETDY